MSTILQIWSVESIYPQCPMINGVLNLSPDDEVGRRRNSQVYTYIPGIYDYERLGPEIPGCLSFYAIRYRGQIGAEDNVER